MKLAVVTDSGSTISRHFGRAPFYLVFTVEDGKIVGQEQREKTGCGHEHHDHHVHVHEQGHGMDAHSQDKHVQMIESIRDCDAVIVRGMGTGAYVAMEQAHIRPFVTDLEDAEAAVQAYVNGTLVDHPERLH